MSNAETLLKQYYASREYPPDSLEYQQSLDIYLSLRNLLKLNVIDIVDIQVIDWIISGYSFRKTAQIVGIDRRSVQTRYRKVLKLLEETL
jgi:hypothetical protein